MLGVDPERVAVVEPCHEISILNDKTWFYQFSIVKQSALFNKNYTDH
jgi:hypothetical protein